MEKKKTHASIEDIRVYADLIKNNFSLCNFYGNCECEVMVAQTIHAAVRNFEQHGDTFSFLGDNARCNHAGGPKNGTALRRLLDDGMFDLGKVEDKDVLYPTRALIDRLDRYFNRKKQ